MKEEGFRLFRIFLISVLLTVMLVSSVFAFQIKTYSAEYDVLEDKTQVISYFDFDQEYDDFVWQLPDDAEEITTSVESKIVRSSGEIFIVVNKSIQSIEISYVSESFVEEADGVFFILDLGNIETADKSILLKLPEDAKLKYSLDSIKSSIIPETNGVITDGRRLIIRWTKDDFAKNHAILVMYELPNNYLNLLTGIVIVAVFFSMGYFGLKYYKKIMIKELHSDAYEEKHHEQKREEHREHKKEDNSHYTKNLFEEEKLIVEVLLKEKMHELWQKQLETKTGLNKVKLSRKLRSLEAKGLIEKIPYGNTNKIRLKKN